MSGKSGWSTFFGVCCDGIRRRAKGSFVMVVPLEMRGLVTMGSCSDVVGIGGTFTGIGGSCGGSCGSGTTGGMLCSCSLSRISANSCSSAWIGSRFMTSNSPLMPLLSFITSIFSFISSILSFIFSILSFIFSILSLLSSTLSFISSISS